MEILIKSSLPDGYGVTAFIRRFGGERLRVNTEALRVDAFYSHMDDHRIPNWLKIYEDSVEKVFNDVRPGKSYCAACFKFYNTGDKKACRHDDAYQFEFFPSTGNGVDYEIDKALEEIYNIRG